MHFLINLADLSVEDTEGIPVDTEGTLVDTEGIRVDTVASLVTGLVLELALVVLGSVAVTDQAIGTVMEI